MLDKQRNSALRKLFSLFNSEETWKQINANWQNEQDKPGVEDLVNLVVALERKINNKETDMSYMKFVRQRYLLLSDKKNPMLKISLLKGDISLENFVNKEPAELAPDEIKRKLKEGKDWKMRA